ncbi:hypothetical protein DDE74_00490 [Streptomyces lydicus]|uniref:histidine kinase n=1 Tax=Streptomyces lydicus TaxID=47763 RepID=A0A3S9YMY4_9ACTN|nr:hypothetical protein DDE74_00490 [Streptomyces lydicus]
MISASSGIKLTEADIDDAFSGKVLPSIDAVLGIVRVLSECPQASEDAAPVLGAQPERTEEWKDRWRELNLRQRGAQAALRRVRQATRSVVTAGIAEAESVRSQAYQHAMQVRHQAAAEAERVISHARQAAAEVNQQAAQLWSHLETELESLHRQNCREPTDELQFAGERVRDVLRTVNSRLSEADLKARQFVEEAQAHQIWPPEAHNSDALRQLQDAAEDLARRRLPQVVALLSQPDHQDMDLPADSVGTFTQSEVAPLADAFDEVYRVAVRQAAEQARLRGSVNAMFINLARRSQGLIQRQLSLLSEVESREADPDQLSLLFRLDHLATRMRRNGENLLVLAGEEPGRRWTRPVPLVDVLRAAASEVEQYERIELSSVPSVGVSGRAINDLVHLLAELLENATTFSSLHTRVRGTGQALPDGRVLIEIHDAGVGLSPEDLADINERLASPPEVDASVSRRMGLFVVSRLSLRHGIRILLRPSDSGGTTVLVMLPVDVVVPPTEARDR